MGNSSVVTTPLQKQKLTAEVVKRKDLTDDLWILWLKPSQKFDFKPGQYCTIGYGGTERPYSIVSAPHEEYIELFFELVPDHLRTPQSLTPRLHTLKPGAIVELRPRAKGTFLLDENYETQAMVATVTGIAPFVSMVRAYLANYYQKKFQKPLYVFQGASYLDEFGYDEELQKIAKSGKIVYVPTVSRFKEERNTGWHGKTGRVNAILEEELKKFGVTSKDSVVYLCGHQGMIDDLGNEKETPEKPLGKLLKSGFKVRSEIYF